MKPIKTKISFTKVPKKKSAKRKNNPMVTKLLDLKYRINEAYDRTTLPTDDSNRLSLELLGDTRVDKQWVMGQISALREGARLDTHQMKKANDLWRKYSSRMINWTRKV